LVLAASCCETERDGEMKGEGGGGKLGRWLGAPVLALSRACDSYVRRMSACAGRMPTHVGGRGGMPAAATFSSRSRRGGGGDDDLNALVRALSQREASAGVPVPVRSRNVAVGRIDEDAPCEFGPDDDVRVGRPPAVRRACSVAVGGFGAAKESAVHG
jgi:hypothetical protein